jgi:hypothetical protein
VFSAATVLLATQASALVLAEAPGPHPGIPLGWIGLGFVIVAAVLRWLINYALILGAILASSPDLRASQLLSKFNEQIVEAGAMAFGLAAAGLLEFDVRLLVVGMVGGLIAFHRTVLLGSSATTPAPTARPACTSRPGGTRSPPAHSSVLPPPV